MDDVITHPVYLINNLDQQVLRLLNMIEGKEGLPAESVDFWLFVKVITIIADLFKPGKDAWVVDAPALEPHVISFLDFVPASLVARHG